MAETRRVLHTEGQILLTQKLKNGQVGIVTAARRILLYDPLTEKVTSATALNEMEPTLRNCAFSPDGRYFAFAQEKPRCIRLIHLETKKLERSFGTFDNPVELVRFDPRSDYIIAGTTTGRVFLWHTESSNLIARLVSFPDYSQKAFKPEHNFVSAFAFKTPFIASSGYGGSIVVTNLQTLANSKRFTPGRVRIDALAFLDEERLLFGNIDGIVGQLHLDGKLPIQRINTGIGPVMHLLALPNRRFALAASHHESVALIDISTMHLTDKSYLRFNAPVVSLCLYDAHSLLVGLAGGELLQGELASFETFYSYLDAALFREAYALCEHEVLLQYTSRFKNLEEMFDRSFEAAREALIEGRPEDAAGHLEPFKNVTSKRTSIDDLFAAFEQYPEMIARIKEKRYVFVYSLASRFPLLKKTPAYDTLEEIWDKAFLKSQQLVFTGNRTAAKHLLFPFNTVMEKAPFIQLLLNAPEVLSAFAKAISQHDFATIKRLSTEHTVLRAIPSYRELVTGKEQMTQQLTDALKLRNFEKAELYLDLLTQFFSNEEHHHLDRLIKKAEKFYLAYDEGKQIICYELLDMIPELGHLPVANKLEALWSRKIRTCEAAALRGNVHAIKKHLDNLLNLKTRSERIGNLLRAAYQIQIKLYISKKLSVEAKEGIINYLALFGMDVELRHIIQLLEAQGVKLKLTYEQKQHRPRSLWMTQSRRQLPDNIVRPKAG